MSWPPIIDHIVRGTFDEKKLETNLVDLETPTKRGGSTPLFFAALMGDERTVEWLLRRGSNVHTRNHYGETPLHWAAQAGSVIIIQMLLGHGADQTCKDHDGWTPLDWSLEKRHFHLLHLWCAPAGPLLPTDNTNP